MMTLVFAIAGNARSMTYSFVGTIGGNKVEVKLWHEKELIDGKYLSGYESGVYRYSKYPSGVLSLRGSNDDPCSTLVFEEYDSRGVHTGHWVLKRSKNGFTGTFTAVKTGKRYSIVLKQIKVEYGTEIF